jgi:hypothetical protein
VSTFPVTQTLALSAHTIDAVGLSELAAVQTARSWSGIAEATLPAGRPGPWTLIDAGLVSAESIVVAQTDYARSIIDATAAALGVTVATTAASAAPAATVEPVTEHTPEPSAAPAPPASKPRAKADGTRPKAPSRTGSSAKGASRRRPAAG